MAYNSGSDPTLAEGISRFFVPDMFSADVIMTAKSDLVCVGAFNTAWRSGLRKGRLINIPVMTGASATEVTPGTEPTAGDLSTTGATITIDKWYESSAEISPMMEVEELADYLKAAATECAYAIDAKIDLDVSSLFSTLGASSVYGSDGQTFKDEIFVALTETLDEADVPVGMRSLIGDPSMKADMFGIDKFVRMDYINGQPTSNGQFGMLYGATVRITNNLTATTTGNYGVLAHKDAIGVVIQKDPGVKYWDLGYKFIRKVIVDSFWGADEVRDSFGKSFYTRKK